MELKNVKLMQLSLKRDYQNSWRDCDAKLETMRSWRVTQAKLNCWQETRAKHCPVWILGRPECGWH